jgi:hypothetical protein
MPSTSCMTRVIKSNRRRSITDSVRIWSHAVSLWPRPYGRVRAGTRTFLSCFAQADVRRQHPKRCHQYPLRLLLSRRSPIPALAQRTFAHAALQADHVPHARAGAAGDTNRHHVWFATALRTGQLIAHKQTYQLWAHRVTAVPKPTVNQP